MDTYEEKFDSSRQESQRMHIALQRFTEVPDPSWKETYRRYLSLRFRPAITELIRHGDLFRIQELCQFAPLTESSLDSFISEAVLQSQEEVLAFFLEFKKEHFGFHDRDFTL